MLFLMPYRESSLQTMLDLDNQKLSAVRKIIVQKSTVVLKKGYQTFWVLHFYVSLLEIHSKVPLIVKSQSITISGTFECISIKDV